MLSTSVITPLKMFSEKELCSDISHQLVYGITGRRLNVITDIQILGSPRYDQIYLV